MRLRARCEPARRELADGDDYVRAPRRTRSRGVGVVAHDGDGAGVGGARRGAGAAGDPRRGDGRAAVADPPGARLLDARELRRLPPRRPDAAADPDHRRPARALRARRRRRGQGRPLQYRPDAGDRGRVLPRPCCVHAAGRDRAQGEPRRACASTRLSDARRRELHEALDHALGRRAPGAVVCAGALHEVRTPGEEVLVQVALKIWRYDSATGDRALRDYEIDAPDEATLLDVLDLIKDRQDGTLAYRKSCRMMICGSCGMRMDGAAVLACKTRMYDIAQQGHIPVISAMGNLPIVKDLVVDMEPFWSKFRAVGPWLKPGYDLPEDGKEHRITQERMNVIHKEALCINCGCCVSECNAMESDPEFLGPQALAKGMRFVGDPRDAATVERLEDYNDEHGIWDCTRCYYCNERCPKGVDPRDAIAKLGAESMKHGIDRDMGAKHAKWFVKSAMTTGWLRETELVPKTQGIVSAVKPTGFAMNLARRGKVPLPLPPHVAERVKEARRLYDVVKTQGRDGALGIVQGERGLARLSHGHDGTELEEIYARPNAQPRPYLPNEDKGQAPISGADGGQGSRTLADVTPGQEPIHKPGGGA